MCFDLSGIAVLKERMHSYPDLREEKIFPEGECGFGFRNQLGRNRGRRGGCWFIRKVVWLDWFFGSGFRLFRYGPFFGRKGLDGNWNGSRSRMGLLRTGLFLFGQIFGVIAVG